MEQKTEVNMARSLLLYGLLVVAIMKSTASTAATTTAEGTTIVTVTELYNYTGSTLAQTSMTTSMNTDTDATMSSSVTTKPETSTADPISSSSSLLTTIELYNYTGSTLTQTSMTTSMATDTHATMSSSVTTRPNRSTSDPISSSSSSLLSLSSAVSATGMTGRTTGPTTETATGPTMELTTGFTTERPTERLTEPTTKPPTEHPVTEEPTTKPSTEQPRVGPVPEPTLPDIEGDATKTYQFEFAVEENTAKGCMSDELNSTACEIFKYNVTQELEAVFGESLAFLSVEVVLSRRNSCLIVSHTVTYSYNSMTDEERMASAQDIYDDTLRLALAEGKVGDYTVKEDCGKFTSPKETSTIHNATVKCQEYSEPAFKTNYWVCESICLFDRDYCNDQGFCWQKDNLYTQPICSCDWDNGEWYWGYRCQYYANQAHLIIGCSCGAAVLLVLLVSLIACCVVKRKTISDKDSQLSDDGIDAFQNVGYDHTAETVYSPILQGNRPYSYLYSKGVDSTNVESSSLIRNQNGGAQRESRLEVNEDAAKRQSNGSADIGHSSLMKFNGSSQQRNPEYWSNLNEPSAEHIKLEPFLDRYEDNDSYKIERPHYNYSNYDGPSNVYPSMDVPAQTQHIPEADYAQ